jgi:hypothetical protein
VLDVSYGIPRDRRKTSPTGQPPNATRTAPKNTRMAGANCQITRVMVIALPRCRALYAIRLSVSNSGLITHNLFNTFTRITREKRVPEIPGRSK